MTDQTIAELVAEARLWPRDGVNEGRLINSLADALEAAEKRAEENRKEIDRLSRELQVAEDQANTIAGDLAQAERERDNWKLSAEEAERAEKRAEQRAEEAERLAEVRRETIREYGRENEAWSVRAHTAERERDRLDEAFDRDLPWRYDEVEGQRNQLAAVVEQARLYCENQGDKFRHHAGRILDMLASDPDDTLREHDARVWASGYNAGYSDRSTPGEPFTRNPYRAREEQDREG